MSRCAAYGTRRATYRNGVSEDLLRGVESVLEDVVPRGEAANVGGGSSRLVALDDIRLDHAVAVHRCRDARQGRTWTRLA